MERGGCGVSGVFLSGWDRTNRMVRLSKYERGYLLLLSPIIAFYFVSSDSLSSYLLS